MCFQEITMPTPPPVESAWDAPRGLVPAASAPLVPSLPREKRSISVGAACATLAVEIVIVAAAIGLGTLHCQLPSPQPEPSSVAVTSANPGLPDSAHHAVTAAISVACPTLSPGVGTGSGSPTMLSPELYTPVCTFWVFDELSGVNTPWQSTGSTRYGRRFFGANPDFQISPSVEGRAYAAPLTAGQIEFLAVK